MQIIVLIGIGVELVLIICYRNFFLKFRKLKGTGRIPDIESANSWKKFFQVMIIIFPLLVLVYLTRP